MRKVVEALESGMVFSANRLSRFMGFAKDSKGMAAIEFAMIAPIMVTLLVGAVEFSQVMTIDRRVSQVASATAGPCRPVPGHDNERT